MIHTIFEIDFPGYMILHIMMLDNEPMMSWL